MLVIRLSRHGRKKLPFYRVVLTEHTKPVKAGYKEVLGSYDPLKHILDVRIDDIKSWISKGAKPSERLAKLLYQQTKDDFFQAFFVHRTRTNAAKKEDVKKDEAPKQEVPKEDVKKDEAPKQEAPKEDVKKDEAPKQEAPKEETPKQEVPKEETPKQEVPKEEAPKEESPQGDAPEEEKK